MGRKKKFEGKPVMVRLPNWYINHLESKYPDTAIGTAIRTEMFGTDTPTDPLELKKSMVRIEVESKNGSIPEEDKPKIAAMVALFVESSEDIPDFADKIEDIHFDGVDVLEKVSK
jgi:hypothetical protein